jgi:glycosyltransferase involved in cell wall biosynthesis
MYYPIDSILKPSWYDNIKLVDRLVAYTDFGKQALLDLDPNRSVDVIHHGVNTSDFKILPEDEVSQFRKHYFGDHSDKFIFMNVNRNQQRKDIPRTLVAFKEFKKVYPESILYLHMAIKDQGWNLMELCQSMGLKETEVVFPENMEPNGGYPREVLNMLYNCCDCILSTTLGEGMGLAWLEAMACNKPVIMPDNTAMSEFITEDKGFLVKSGSSPSLWTCIPNDNEVLRPIVDVEDLVGKMKFVYENYGQAKKRAQTAYEWVTEEMAWSGSITKKWLNIFDEEANNIGYSIKNSSQNVIKSELL